MPTETTASAGRSWLYSGPKFDDFRHESIACPIVRQQMPKPLFAERELHTITPACSGHARV